MRWRRKRPSLDNVVDKITRMEPVTGEMVGDLQVHGWSVTRDRGPEIRVELFLAPPLKTGGDKR